MASPAQRTSEGKAPPDAAPAQAGGHLFAGGFEAATVPMAVATLGLEILEANPALEALTGRPAAELRGRRVGTFSPASASDDIRGKVAAILAADPAPFKLDVTVQRADGSRTAVELSSSVLRHPDGTPRHYLLHGVDVTARMETEAELARERRFLADAQSLAHVGSWEWDLASNEFTWSAELEAIFGGSPGATPGIRPDWMDAVHPDDVEALEAAVAQARGGESTESEYRIIRPDGEVRWMHGRRRGLSPTRIVGTIQDVTARRRQEDELRASEQAALEASRMKSQFLANMSHEIRTPMNGVLGMVDALLHSDLAPEQRRHAETARQSAESLLTIIDDLLDFSKIEAGRLELEAAPIDIIQLLEDLRQLMWPRAQSRGLRLLFRLGPEVPDVLVGDPIRLRQVLVNLLSNAIKFSEDGEVVLSVDRLDGDRVRFAVTDPGIGIDAGTLARLFTPFTQADASTTRRFGGTGLGLAISRQLAQLMGGTIDADSVPGHGSTFTFTAALPPGPGSGGPRRLEGLPVLVVTDTPRHAEALVVLLERWGATAVTAPLDGAEAVLAAALAGPTPPRAAVVADPRARVGTLALVERLRAQAGGVLPAVLTADAAYDVPLPPACVALVSPAPSAAVREGLAQLTQPMPAAAPPAALAPPPPAPERLGEGRRVLVAEDNEVNQQVARLSLRRRGFEVDVVADGAAAVEASAATRYDLIFMDCHMPVMDGFAATAAILDRPGPDTAPIIALTASSMPEDRERCRAAGMSDFLGKPVRGHELDAVLAAWLVAPGA